MAFLKDNQFVFNYRRMWPFIKPYWKRGLLGIFLTLPVGALDAVVAAFLKPITDSVLVDKNVEFSRLLPYIVLGFTLVQGLFNYAAAYINTWVGAKITMGLKKTMYDKLLSMESIYYDRRNSGDVLFRYSGDPDLAAGGLVANLKLFLTKVFSSFALFGVMLYNSWQLTIIAISVFVLAVYPVKKVKGKIKGVTVKTVEAASRFLTNYNETFSGHKIISSFTLEKIFKKKFSDNLDYLFNLSIKMIQGSGWLSPLLHFIGSIGLALVLGTATHFIVSGEITPGNFVAFIAAMLMLYRPLKSIGSNYVQVQQAFLAIDRIFEILDTKPSIVSDDDAMAMGGLKKGIEFKNVDFSYVPGRPVLKGVYLKIEVGKTTALVGNSGGGKTTIAALLPRLYDISGGEILIDGRSIKSYTLKSLRQNMGVVFQDNFLFSGTLRENLLYGRASGTEQDMWQALTDANLVDFVKESDKGLEMLIGERGILLSGGQKQRVAIARAFMKNAPLVILDEATSALDSQSEKAVQKALEKLMESRTVVVIAHRLSTIRNADNILVVNDGRIIEQGRHEELINRCGAYHALYSTQFAGPGEE